MFTAFLVIMAPLSIVLLPSNYGIPVAFCLVVVLAFREWEVRRRTEQEAEQNRSDELVSFRDSVSEHARLAAEAFRHKH